MAVPSLVGAPPPLTDAKPLTPAEPPKPRPLDDTEERQKQFNDETKVLTDKMSSIGEDTRKKNEALEGKMGLQRPPEMKQVPYNPPQRSTPQEQWGSWAMTFAMLGSLMTRRPMITAMNAGAAVMNAFKQGDKEAADTAYKQWEVANKNAMELADYQQKAYQNAMSTLNRQQSNNTAAGSAQERAVQAQLNAHAAAFRDTNMLKIGQERGLAGQERELDRREKEMQEGQRKDEAMRLKYSQMKKNEEITSSPGYQAAAQSGNSMEMLRLLAEGGDPRAMTQYARAKSAIAVKTAKADETKEVAAARNESTQAYIDRALEIIPQMGTGALSQAGEKLYERAAGALGVNVENPAQTYDAYIDSIKNMILAEQKSAGTHNKEYRQALDALLPKINHWAGSSGQETQLKILSNTLNRMHGLPERYTEAEVMHAMPNVPKPAPDVPTAPQVPGGTPAAQPASTAPTAPKVDAARTPTDADKKAAKLVSSPEEFAAAPPGWLKDPTGAYVYKSGP